MLQQMLKIVSSWPNAPVTRRCLLSMEFYGNRLTVALNVASEFLLMFFFLANRVVESMSQYSHC